MVAEGLCPRCRNEKTACMGPGARRDDAVTWGNRYLRIEPMDAREIITVGMSAERIITVRPDLTVKHFVPKMPAVYATPMMIMEMEMASADAISPYLAQGWVTAGTGVAIRHPGASAVRAKARTPA